jgi:serine/threonine protein kinase
MAAAPNPQQRQEITLLQERCAGTFSRVYLAEAHSQDGISRIVAVKILKTQWSSDPELLNRTHDEARLLARLHHRNILRVEALAELSGQPAIIMEFVDGIDLKQIIERTTAPMPPRAAYRIVRDTAAALEAAYFRAPYGRDEPLHVIHRDIKPSNIMVSVEGDVKVLDFGTARYQNEIRLAQTGALRFGSLKYMSPERRAGDRGEHSSDIYSLGLLLIEMLLGELLPVMPLDQEEHDRNITELLARVTYLGLPNTEWEASLRQTIARMCAFHCSHRLDAQQAVQLMRAFADQANGASLDSYAADTVARLSAEIFTNKPKGDYSGQRLSISLTSSGSSTREAPAEPAPMEDTATVTDPSSVAVTYEPAEEPGPDLSPDGPFFSGGHAQDIPASGPSFGAQIGYGSPPDESIDESAWGSAADPAPEHESDQPRSRNLLIIGVIAAFLGVMFAFTAAGVVFGGYYYFTLKQSDPNTTTDPIVVLEPDPVVIAPPPADSVDVTVAATDDSIQWLKLADADGTTLFKADPEHTAALPPGEYTLTAKIVARPKVSAALTVTDAPLSLRCAPGEPAEEQTVICERDGADPLVLSP